MSVIEVLRYYLDEGVESLDEALCLIDQMYEDIGFNCKYEEVTKWCKENLYYE